MKKVLIYGSCGSRDAFEVQETQKFEIVEYFARSSFASALCSIPTQDTYSQVLKSSFQRRQVHRDLTKSLTALLPQIDFDIFLIDFIDERFDVFRFDRGPNTGSIITLSNELRKSGVLDTRQGTKIRALSDEGFSLWCSAWDRFVRLLEKLGVVERLRINQLFWAMTGTRAQDELSAQMNVRLSEMYAYCALTIEQSQFVHYDDCLFIHDPDHKWGAAPFHYSLPLYQKTLERLEG